MRDKKLVASIREAIIASGLKDGMTISFHHHMRNGDYVLNMVMEEIAAMGIKGLTLNATALFDIHLPLIEHIKNGVVTTLMTNYMSAGLGKIICTGIMENPVQFRTHGTRPDDIIHGRTPIDVAFVAAPQSDDMGNCTGKYGKSACGAFGYARNAMGMSAWDVAKWTVEGEDNVARSIGGAVLSAASQQLDIADDTDDKCRYGMEITSEDTVGMIGFIKPVAKTLKSQVKKLYVFDEGVSLYEGTMRVCGMDQQPVLLPECTKMIITGSSTINGSIDGLLEMCANADQIALVGSSTPMFPEGWKGTKVTALAGAWWPKERKEEIFRIISQGGGIAQLKSIIQHKIAFV